MMPRTISWLFLPISLRLRYFVPESVSLQRFWYQICPNSDIAQQHRRLLRWDDTSLWILVKWSFLKMGLILCCSSSPLTLALKMEKRTWTKVRKAATMSGEKTSINEHFNLPMMICKHGNKDTLSKKTKTCLGTDNQPGDKIVRRTSPQPGSR